MNRLNPKGGVGDESRIVVRKKLAVALVDVLQSFGGFVHSVIRVKVRQTKDPELE